MSKSEDDAMELAGSFHFTIWQFFREMTEAPEWRKEE